MAKGIRIGGGCYPILVTEMAIEGIPESFLGAAGYTTNSIENPPRCD